VKIREAKSNKTEINVQIHVYGNLDLFEVKKKFSSFSVLTEDIMKKTFLCHVAPHVRKEKLIWIPERNETDISCRIFERIQSISIIIPTTALFTT